ncbi:hypothetical protein [Planobispora longispora]|uniref:Uncharacterized protein n=1 Tax=Planobispora longispora TaxID=28887 RepID=A0A8J3RPX1_9ACTN|nr:hypothetical protein [Planobispora longispora]BFE85798.1 hypothetical protein GCM10020093_083990 [Planobispora longispora]GIH76168.1 hypothetical protein Plo01_25970 [Planobispora longispora]
MNFPADAYPPALYSASQHTTPDTIRVESTEDAIIVWLTGLMIGVPRTADDTRLHAALDSAWRMGQALERYGSEIRAELERRERERAAEVLAAAARATKGPTSQPLVVDDLRYCNGCGGPVGRATPVEQARAAEGLELPDARVECRNCTPQAEPAFTAHLMPVDTDVCAEHDEAIAARGDGWRHISDGQICPPVSEIADRDAEGSGVGCH